MLGLLPGRALAGGIAAPTVGPGDSGVSTTGPSSIFHNPGGIGFADAPELMLGGGLVIGDLRFRRQRLATYQYPDSLDFALPIDQSAVDRGKTGPDDEVHTLPAAPVPALFARMPIPDLPLVAGFGVYVPYAAKANFPADGAQRWQVIDAMIAATHVTPSIAWRVHERVSVGLGVSYVVGFADLTKVQDLASLPELGRALGDDPINQPNDFGPGADPAMRELDTMSRPFAFRNGWAHSGTFNLGVTARPVDPLWIGVSYAHSTPMTFNGNFKLDMNDPFFTQDLAAKGLLYPKMVTGKARMHFTLPYTLRAGLRYEFGRLGDRPRSSIALEGALTGWSTVKSFDVRVSSPALAQPELGLAAHVDFDLPRNWRNTYMGQLRVTHRVTPTIRSWVTLGVETAAVPDGTIDAASPDGVRMLGGAGAGLPLGEGVELLLDLHMQGIIPRRVTRSDHDLGNGTYGLRIYALNVFLARSF